MCSLMALPDATLRVTFHSSAMMDLNCFCASLSLPVMPSARAHIGQDQLSSNLCNKRAGSCSSGDVQASQRF